jgi:hypothetical protein
MKKKIANWGNYPVIEANETSFALAEQLQDLLVRNEKFIPRGNGRCYGDASLASNTISTLNSTRYFPSIKRTVYSNARVDYT